MGNKLLRPVGLIKRYIKAYSQKVKNNTDLFEEISQLHKQLQKNHP
jgi:hypothetical protein